MSGLVVLKLGGRVAADAVRDALSRAGGPAVVVHGAGPQITEQMARRGIEPVFVRGRRVTTPEVLEVVRVSLEAVNAEVCAAIGPAPCTTTAGPPARDSASRTASAATLPPSLSTTRPLTSCTPR